MRRKSERNKKAKASPEKVETPKRGRTTRRKKASSSSEAESVEDASPQAPEVVAVAVPSPEPAPVAADPQAVDDKVWQVKAAESCSGAGEIKKLKICLSTRPSSTPERSPHGRKKLNRTVSSSDTTAEGADERRRSRHRSRRSARESKDEADRIHEARSEEDDHKMSKLKSLPENEESKDVKEVEEATSTEVHPESTTSESVPPIEPVSVVVAFPTNEENGTNLKNAEEPSPQADSEADTTGENNHEEKVDEQRPKGNEKATRASRKSPEIERSPEQSEYEQSKSANIVEQPEEIQPEPAKSPEVVEKLHDKKSEEVVDVSNNSEQNECENLESAKSQSPDKVKPEDTPTVAGTLENEPDKSKSEESSVIERRPEKPSIEIVNKDDSTKSSSPRDRELRTPQSEPEEVFEVQRSKSSVHVRSNAEKENTHNSISSDVTNHTKADDIIEDVAKNIEEYYPATPIVVSRKRRWGTRASKVNQSRPVSISTDILKDIIPDVKPAELEEVIHEKRHRKKSENVEKHRVERPILPKIVIDNTENANLHRREKDKEHKERASDTPILEHRKISLVKEDNFVGRPPSPPRHKSSAILFISNLVRPFTLAQLKNLLQRTGKIVPDGFWIDRIKSKCFVTYENEDQAVETRHALHGVTWPVSNPKTLQVDFSSQDALDRSRAAEAENKDQPSAIPGTVEDWMREQDAKKERFGETDESKPWDRRNIVREWDVGKGEKEKERNKRDERPQEKRRHKSPERSPEPARKFKKKEEEAPAKMLDDLFRKTKTVPCIYWLPLSAETIAVKEEQRRQHMAEHERRMQELERSRTHRRH